LDAAITWMAANGGPQVLCRDEPSKPALFTAGNALSTTEQPRISRETVHAGVNLRNAVTYHA
jgi:hypothetical protein